MIRVLVDKNIPTFCGLRCHHLSFNLLSSKYQTTDCIPFYISKPVALCKTLDDFHIMKTSFGVLFHNFVYYRDVPCIPVNSPHKWPVTRKIFPFDDVIMSIHIFIEYSHCCWVWSQWPSSAFRSNINGNSISLLGPVQPVWFPIGVLNVVVNIFAHVSKYFCRTKTNGIATVLVPANVCMYN